MYIQLILESKRDKIQSELHVIKQQQVTIFTGKNNITPFSLIPKVRDEKKKIRCTTQQKK